MQPPLIGCSLPGKVRRFDVLCMMEKYLRCDAGLLVKVATNFSLDKWHEGSKDKAFTSEVVF